MAPEIRPLRDEDVEELGRFLAEGFGAGPDAEFSAIDVLRWKYLEPIGGDEGPRSFVARDEGRIVGHSGIVPSRFVEAGGAPEGVSAIHMIDWLGSKEHRSVGVSLMRRAHARGEVQYGIGGSEAGRRTARRAGYRRMPPLPLFRKTLRLSSRLREPGSPSGRVGRLARDLVRGAASARVRDDARGIRLTPTGQFGDEVGEVLARWRGGLVASARTSGALNHLLGYPRGGPTGWRVEQGGRVVGFAMLNVLPRGRLKVGRVVELFLDTPEPDEWTAAASSLVEALRSQGADVAEAIGSTPWADRALRRLGFAKAYDLDFHLRDRGGRVPLDKPFHLTFFEGDYAYT